VHDLVGPVEFDVTPADEGASLQGGREDVERSAEPSGYVADVDFGSDATVRVGLGLLGAERGPARAVEPALPVAHIEGRSLDEAERHLQGDMGAFAAELHIAWSRLPLL